MLSSSWFEILTFFGLWSTMWLPIVLLISRFIDWQPNKPLTVKQKLILLASLYILIPVIVIWKINVDSLSLASLGLTLTSNLLTHQLLGLILSIGSLIFVFTLESLFNLIDWHWQNIRRLVSLIFPIFFLSLSISVVEELVFRGYIFSTLLADNSIWIAAVTSSLIFALLHLVWEKNQTLPQVPGLWLMGLVLVGARVVGSDSLYLAIGLHTGWILGLTCIDSAELVTYRYQSHWITGVNQQPLAGAAGILCLMITGLIMFSLMPSIISGV